MERAAGTPDLDGNSSLQAQGSSSRSITRIDRKLYFAAVKGSFDEFYNVQNIEDLLTPNKNTVLHVHLASQPTKNVSKPLSEQILSKLRGMKPQPTKTAVSEQFVEQILDECGRLVSVPNVKGETPLHIAARYGHSGIAKLLIERAGDLPQDIENGIGADNKLQLIRARNGDKDAALHEAVRYGHYRVVKLLLEMDPDHSYSANNANETPLYMASERQYQKMVREILKILKSPAYGGPNGRTALHAAVINGDTEMAKVLLEKNEHLKAKVLLEKNEHLKAAVKHADRKGWVPLHYAVKMGHEGLTKLLLEEDQNTAYMQDIEGMTALHIAAFFNRKDIMEMILHYYPDCSELVDKKGCNALQYAVNGHSFGAVASIMRHSALSNLYNEKDVDGNTPLHHLALGNWGANPPSLVSHPRVDKLATNNKFQTPLDVAYVTVEDSNRRLTKQDLIVRLKTAGDRRSPDLDEKAEDVKEKNQKLVFTEKTKETHLIVATLIATVSFAAGFTLPGGTIQDGEHQGYPILGQTASFKAFIVSNTIALVTSASAAFIHLFSPFDKSRWKDYYLSQVAFSFTLVSVATMILAFATGLYAVLGSSSSVRVAVLILGLSFFLVLRQVLRMTVGYALFAFMGNLYNIIIFPFQNYPSRWFGYFPFEARRYRLRN